MSASSRSNIQRFCSCTDENGEKVGYILYIKYVEHTTVETVHCALCALWLYVSEYHVKPNFNASYAQHWRRPHTRTQLTNPISHSPCLYIQILLLLCGCGYSLTQTKILLQFVHPCSTYVVPTFAVRALVSCMRFFKFNTNEYSVCSASRYKVCISMIAVFVLVHAFPFSCFGQFDF